MNRSAAESVLLDASVLVELITQGRHADAADRLLDHLERHPHVEIVTAAHGLIEVQQRDWGTQPPDSVAAGQRRPDGESTPR